MSSSGDARRTRIGVLTERMMLGYGVDLVVDEQCDRLAALGFDVTVAVIRADPAQPRRRYRLVMVGEVLPGPVDYADPAAVQTVTAALELADADLWILHTPPFYDWAPHLPAPVVAVEYGAPPGSFFPRAYGRAHDAVAATRLSKIYAGLLPCDAIVSISRSLHAWLPDDVRHRSTVVHLGCDHYPAVGEAEAGRMRASLGVNPKHCLALWIGRMQLDADEQPYKGFQELLDLIPLVRRQAPDLRFVVTGRVSTADTDALRERGLVVVPNASARELAELFAAADVLVNLSKWEGFNLALLEAQFQGTPVIAYAHGPHAEVVEDGRTGLLVETPQALFQAVVHLATDAAARGRLGANARAFARAFTWDHSMAAFVEVLERCLAATPGPSPELMRLRATAARHTQPAVPPVTARAALLGFCRRLVTRFRYCCAFLVPPRFSDWFRYTDEEFVEATYRTLLGREVEASARAEWTAALAHGRSRDEVIALIRHSTEGRQRRLADATIDRILFSAWLRRVLRRV